MRLLAAIALFFISLGMLFAGVAERTIWAPAPSHNLSVKYDSTNPYVVIPASTLLSFSGNPSITVSGTSKVFVSSGREADVLAWVGQAPHTELKVVSEKSNQKLEPNSIYGAGLLASPLGSDLWRNSVSASSAASLEIANTDGAAVLIASDGIAAAPSTISIDWPIAHDLTQSNFLLIGGGIVLLAAFLMNIWAIGHHRRKRGPRRKVPRAPQGPRTRRRTSQIVVPARGRRAARKVRYGAAIALGLAALSGCASGSTSPTPTPSSTGNSVQLSPPVLNSAQIQRIIQNVSDVATKADRTGQKSLLSLRFSGPALDMRAAHYFLQSKSKNVGISTQIAASPLTFSLPAATSEWPRTIMVVTDPPGETLPQMLVLQQDTPRSQYLVNFVVGLMPGAKIPAVSVPEVGAIPASPDSVYLRLPPLDIPVTYGDVIDNGAASLSSAAYDVTHDAFYKDVAAGQKAQVAKLTKGKIKFKHSLGSGRVIALSTTSGGALVAIFMKDYYTITPVKAGSAVSVSGLEKIMLGAGGSTKGIRSIYGDMMLFYVPALNNSERIRLLGVTQGLLDVKGL
jgi:hypothetical protein